MERTMLENYAGESRWSGLCCEDSTEEPHDCTSPNIFGMPTFRRYFTFFERLQGFQDELSLPMFDTLSSNILGECLIVN